MSEMRALFAGGSSVLVAASLALIVVAFGVDLVGLSRPGLGPVQTNMVWAGATLLVGTLFAPALRREGRAELGAAARGLVEAVRASARREVLGIGVLFVAAAAAGTAYVAAAEGAGSQAFYEATERILPSRPFGGALYPFYPYGVFFGSVVTLAYGLFRVGMGVPLALGCAIAFAISPNHLHNLMPSIMRDYARVPVMLGVLAVIAGLFRRPPGPAVLLVTSGAVGIILGLGTRIRQDVSVLLVPYLILLACLPWSPRRGWAARFTAALVLLFAFSLSTPPAVDREGAYGAQRVVAGFMSWTDERIGVTPAAYGWGHLFLDELARSLPFSHAHASGAVGGGSSRFAWEDYAPVGYGYVRALTVHFPADMVARTYAAVLRVLDFPFAHAAAPVGVSDALVLRLYEWRAALLTWPAGAGAVTAGLALLVMSARNVRAAVFCLLLVLFVAGIPVLQFQGRHYFHLEIFGWWAVGFLIHAAVTAAWAFKSRARSGEAGQRWQSARRAAVFAVVAVALVGVPLGALRAYQRAHVEDLLRRYEAAARERLPEVREAMPNGAVLVTSPELVNHAAPGQVAARFLVAEFDSSCGQSTTWPNLRYSGRTYVPAAYRRGDHGTVDEARGYVLGRSDFSQTLRVDVGNGHPTRVFFLAQSLNAAPIVGPLASHFMGIELPREQERCLLGLYRVREPHRLPVLVTAIVPAPPDRATPYQRIAVWESERVYTVPADMPQARIHELRAGAHVAVGAADATWRADIVHAQGGGWVIRGYATPPADAYNRPVLDRSRSSVAAASFVDVSVGQVDTDLLVTREVALPRGGHLLAEGTLRRGGVTFSILADGRAFGFLHVTTPGRFTVLMEVPRGGRYAIGLANRLDGYTSVENRAEIGRLGWVPKAS